MIIINTIAYTLRWLIEAVLACAHSALTYLGMPADAGITWLFAILAVLILTRLCVLPLTLGSAHNNQKLAALTPQLRALAAAHAAAGQKNPFKQLRATIRLWRDTRTSPLGSIFPMLIQVPIFLTLYTVLHAAEMGHPGMGLMTSATTRSFEYAKIFGIPLRLNLFATNNQGAILLGLSVIIITAAVQFFIQFINYRYNRNPEDQTKKAQQVVIKIPMILTPIMIIATSLAVQLGLNFYLLASACWTIAQQHLVLRLLPFPGSRAAAVRIQRLQRR